MIRQLMNSVDLLLNEKLAAIGFDRKERFIYTCKLERDALGWLGFPSRGDGRKLVLAINVGVLFPKLQKLVLGDNYVRQNRLVANVITPIYALIDAQSYLSFVFGGDLSDNKVADETVEIIAKYGLPQIRRLSKLSEFESILRSQLNGRLTNGKLSADIVLNPRKELLGLLVFTDRKSEAQELAKKILVDAKNSVDAAEYADLKIFCDRLNIG